MRCTFLPDKYRKNKATFHAVPPARVRPPPTTLLPLVPAPGVGPPALPAWHTPGQGVARSAPRQRRATPWWPPAGHRPAPPGTARTGGWGRAAGAAGAAERCLKAAGAARGGRRSDWQLSLQAAVLRDRHEYRVERLFHRLKNRVQIAPLFVKLNEQIEGLT